MNFENNHTPFGQAFPIGATVLDGGVNFSIFSKNATQVELLLFEGPEATLPSKVYLLDSKTNRTGFYWHIFLPGLTTGQVYGYRIDGPVKPQNGHRFNANKLLLDPYSKSVVIPEHYDRKEASGPIGNIANAMKSVVVDTSTYDWEGDQHPRNPFSRTVIYEVHVAGFTKNPNSGVSADKRGTYAGFIEKIPYLRDLGVTAVELLPVFQYDEQDAPTGQKNYWGYSPISFFAPHQAYSSRKDNIGAIDEFRDLVKALHKEGIEVILDVVYNHTAEGDENGPTLCFKGIENRAYYLLDEDQETYSNYSGTGNSLNANHSIVRRMIMDSLRFWVSEMHIDGFRFDLASILSRDEFGQPLKNPPILWEIESDPVLAGTKLIAEAWDAAGLYQVGQFIGDRWKEWNGKFRDDVRHFIKGDSNSLSNFASRLLASPDIYGHKEHHPETSINFVTCHDGFTLNDLVSYNEKHNEANGENNRDGHNDNISWNHGVEGPTDDLAIIKLRNQQIKNFLAVTLLSYGTPMLLMGDEVKRTQLGNNNAYCQDNELNWFDWSLLEKNREIYRFVQLLIEIRLHRDVSIEDPGLSLNEFLEAKKVIWHGIQLDQPDWSPHSRSIAFTIWTYSEDYVLHFMFNSFHEDLEFEIPDRENTADVNWRLMIDTALPTPHDINKYREAQVIDDTTYMVKPRSMVVLFKWI